MAQQRGITFLDNQRDIFQQVIREHSKTPWHRGKTNPVHRYHKCCNPDCGDTIELTLQLSQTNDIIEDIKFEGEGCAISIASADLMANSLQGKSVVEALEIIEKFRSMVKGEGEFPQEFKKLTLLKGLSNYPLRIKCATLSWHTLKAALES